MFSSVPNWSNRVDDVFGFKVARGSYNRLACWKTCRQLCCAYFFAFFKYFWSAFAVNCLVYASASHERRVSCVHYGVCFHFGYVASDQTYCCSADLSLVFFHSSYLS